MSAAAHPLAPCIAWVQGCVLSIYVGVRQPARADAEALAPLAPLAPAARAPDLRAAYGASACPTPARSTALSAQREVACPGAEGS